MAQLGYDELLQRLIRQESGGNPNAISPVGAAGIMQVMPATGREIAAELGETDIAGMDDRAITQALMDPARGKRYGEHYLKKQLAAFGGDPTLALIAYNAGPGRAQQFAKHRDMSRMPRETQGYVSSILGGGGADAAAGGGGSDGFAGYSGLLSGGGSPAPSGGADPFPQASGREKWATWLMGLGQAFRGNADPRYLTAVSELENKGVNENKTYKALLSRGIDPATAEWAVRDPRVMQQLAQQLFAPKASKSMTVQEIFDPATGQPQKVLFDQVTGEYQPI
ncbi:MAG: transglycosylase SLT domain-containing protein, partial [Myxococcales bacterium]|nr:transglycosylase SLT domain-containing protein [Myxococcales bacterium]